MADYSVFDEATLNEKLKAATDYDERAAIRKALRQLKKEQGRPVGRATKSGGSYNRFAGTSAAATKAVTPKSFIGKEQGAEQPLARGPTPTKTPPTYSPAPVSSPWPHTPSPSQESPAPPEDETDGIPPHTDELEAPTSPEVPSPSPPRPLTPSPPPSPPSEKFQEEEVDDGTNEEEEPAEEEEEPEEEEEEEEEESEEEEEEETINGTKEEAEPDEKEAEPEDEEVEPESKEEEEEPDVKEEEERPRPPADEKPAVKPKTTAADDSDGSPFGARVRSRRPENQTSSPREKEVEFQGFRLRKTLSQEQQGKSPRGTGGGVDFGVKLRSRPSPSTTDALPSRTEPQHDSSQIRSRAKTVGSARQTPSSSGPRTLRDYQQLSARSQRSKVKSPDEDESAGGSTMPVDELQRYLVAYVNQELALSPLIPSRGRALYDVCSNTANLCKLINKSVRNTVDLRALTTISPNMSAADREEAEQENMTLTTESARAIGCRVTDSTGDLILGKDPPTIRGFLVDLIRARVVNMPGMDDEPASTFTNLSVLFSKLGISEGVDGGENGEGGGEGNEGVNWREMDTEGLKQALQTPPKSPPSSRSWRDMDKPTSPTTQDLTYEERAAQRRAERERKEQERNMPGMEDTSTLTYEERAALRRAERERRRQERADLATSH